MWGRGAGSARAWAWGARAWARGVEVGAGRSVAMAKSKAKQQPGASRWRAGWAWDNDSADPPWNPGAPWPARDRGDFRGRPLRCAEREACLRLGGDVLGWWRGGKPGRGRLILPAALRVTAPGCWVIREGGERDTDSLGVRGLRAGKGESNRHWTLYRNLNGGRLQVPWRGATRETDRVSKTLLVFTPNYQTVTFSHLSPKRQVEAGVCAPQPYAHAARAHTGLPPRQVKKRRGPHSRPHTCVRGPLRSGVLQLSKPRQLRKVGEYGRRSRF